MNPLIIPVAYKLALASIEYGQAKKLERNNPRPEYKIPESAFQALNSARFAASRNRVPGQDRAEALMEKNMSNAAYRMAQATDNPNQITENLSRMASSNNDTINRMAISGAQMKRQAERDLNAELDTMARFEQQKYHYDKIAPYQEAMAKSAQLKEAGRQNGYDALKTGVQLSMLGDGNIPGPDGAMIGKRNQGLGTPGDPFDGGGFGTGMKMPESNGLGRDNGFYRGLGQEIDL